MTHEDELKPPKCGKPFSKLDKFIVSILAGLLFLLFASPFMFTLTNKLLSPVGLTTSSSDGCPTVAGLIVHSVVYIVVTYALMR